MALHVAPLFVDSSQRIIDPLYPVSANKPLVCPTQIAVELFNTPPLLCEITSINAGVAYSTGAVPL